MHVRCSLRRIRGDRTIEEIARQTGVSRGLLSEVERGKRFPPDTQTAALEDAYGAPAHEWYEPAVLLAIQRDSEDRS